ncbi:MAG: hypothetical protein M5U26_27615 [Planctomycetota bacterium]|nr:hypothetical protein [Planctomycetota bacterium]
MRKNPTLPLVFASLLLGLYAPGASAADDALELFAGTDGRTQVQTGGRTLGALDVACFDKAWRGAGALAEKGDGPDEQTHLIRMRTPFGAVFKGSIRMAAEGEAAAASLKLTPDKPAELNSLHIAGEFPVANCLGGSWKTDSAEGAFPENLDPDKIHLFGNKAKFLELTLAGGANVRFEFPQPTSVLIQDNRKWSRDFVIRLILAGEGDNGQTYQAGKEYELAFRIASRGGVKLTHDKPLVLVANEEWKPLKTDLRIEPGSALDFSELGFLDAPAGKHGWIQTNAQGQFVFEKRPDKPVRFYGVNFCFSANYMTHEQSDELAERLARLGYNAIRIHHYEGELCQGQPLSTTFNPEKLDQLDYLLAACFKRGIYATTDLYVSRPIKKSELGLPGDGNEGRFKELAHIHGGAFANWKLFSKNLLEHVNPYTRRSWAEEPGLAWICMLNEDNLANHINTLLEIPEWVRAWNAWLAARYETREKLNAAWEGKLKDGQDPAQGNVEMLGNIHSRGDPRQKRSRGPPRRIQPPQLRAHEAVRARRAGLQGAVDRLQRLDQPGRRRVDARALRLRGRPLLHRSPAVHRAGLATAQPLPEHQPHRRRGARRSRQRLRAALRQAVHDHRVQLLRTGALPRRRRDPHRRARRAAGLGRALALRVLA